MKVIFAGYSKSGTKSMASAFNTLGYRTYDLMDHFWNHKDQWNKIWKHGATVEDFKEMYKDVDAICAAPSFMYWEKILEAFPDAKVILTIRDEEAWLKSLSIMHKNVENDHRTNLMLLMSPTGMEFYKFRRQIHRFYGRQRSFPWLRLKWFPNDFKEKLYKEHNHYVQTKCPSEKLLIFDMKQGWESLCGFLGKEIPQQDFPHKNKGGKLYEEMRKTNPVMQKINREFKITLSLIISTVGCLIYYVLLF